MARNDDLAGVIVIGDGAGFALCRRLCQRFSLLDICTKQSGHSANAHRHRRLHRLPAQLQQLCRGRQIERSGCTKRCIFAERVSGDKIAFLRKPDAALFFQHPQGRNCIRHNRGLCVFGQRQVAFRPFAHQLEKILPQRVVNLLKHGARGDACFGERLAHANGLAALSRKNECAHMCSRLSFFLANRLWRGARCGKPERHDLVVGVMPDIGTA